MERKNGDTSIRMGIYLIFRKDEIFNYLPDDFVSGQFARLFFEGDENVYNDKNKTAAITQREERISKWNKDYYEFLEYTKNRSYGKEKCGRCLLSGADRDYDSMNIKDIIIGDLQKKLGNKDERTDNSCHSADDNDNSMNPILAKSPSPLPSPPPSLEYPCPIANRFECPYTNFKTANDDYLVMVGEMVQVVCDAIHHAHSLTSGYNDKTYLADFESGRVEVYHRYSGWYSVGKLEQVLQHVILSKVPVKTVKDIFHILTDEQTLRIVLDQYPELNTFQKEQGEQAAKEDFKELIIKFFMKICNIFTLQELRDPQGRTLEESINVYKFLESNRSPESFTDNEDSICDVCQDRWANIQCLNCNVWICANHWRQHKIEKQHTYPLTK
jgi:hypothetical protein